MNRKIREFEDVIIELLNAADLEIEIKRLVLSNVLNLVTKQADAAIMAEMNEENNE